MKLDENFTLKGKKYNWELEYSKDTGKLNEKGEKIIKKDKWYFPKIEQVLNRYKEEALKPCASLDEILRKLEELQQTIESLRLKQ